MYEYNALSPLTSKIRFKISDFLILSCFDKVIFAKTILDGLVGVQIYPNPTAGLFEITIPTSKTEVEVEIYSTGSQLISKWKYPVINQRIQLSLEKESDGVYFARVKLDVPVSLTIIKKS